MLKNKAVVWALIMAFVLSCFPAVSFAAEDACFEYFIGNCLPNYCITIVCTKIQNHSLIGSWC